MAKAKANIANLSDVDKIARGRKWEKGLRGNTQLPVGVGDALADQIKAPTDVLETKLAVKNTAQNALTIAVNEEETASTDWSAVVPQVTTQIDIASGGDQDIILSTGWQVADSSSTTLPAPGKVMNLHASVGDEPGHVDLAWNGQSDATSYADEIWQGDDVTAANWAYGAPLKGKKSKAEITGLVSGSRYWFRVRAANTEDGPWSEPVSIIAP